MKVKTPGNPITTRGVAYKIPYGILYTTPLVVHMHVSVEEHTWVRLEEH